MLTRIVTATIGGVLFIGLLLQGYHFALGVIAFLHALAIFEYCRLQPKVSRTIVYCAIVLQSILLVLLSQGLFTSVRTEYAAVAVAVAMVIYAAMALVSYERRQGGEEYWFVARSILCVTMPFAFVTPVVGMSEQFPYLLLLIGASFGADSGGIFAGKLIGRRHHIPRLSPKKTVEGTIAGLLTGGASWALTALLFREGLLVTGGWLTQLPLPAVLGTLFAGGVIASAAGMIGDLTFSLFKRQAGVKDYGRLLPGHGGVLDRFDAFIFVAPLVYLLTLLMRLGPI
jgi:phosphatidate cytidylyltransferase